LIPFPQLAPSREPSHPSPAGRAQWSPHSLQVAILLNGPEQDMVLCVLDPAHGKPVELLFAADVGIGTLVPADWIAPGSIHPVPRLLFHIGLGLKIRICSSPPSLIIGHHQFYGSFFPSWVSALFQYFRRHFPPQFSMDVTLVTTAFMTRRSLTFLGPLPPHPLYNRLSARFTTLPTPLSSPSSTCASHPTLSSSCFLLHPFISLWASRLLQSPPREVLDPLRLRRVNAPSPLNGNTERCSRMVPVRSGPRASRKFLSMVRWLLPHPFSRLTCEPLQGSANTGNLHGPRTREAAADGGTNSSSTT
jgi:hypothetical protein